MEVERRWHDADQSVGAPTREKVFWENKLTEIDSVRGKRLERLISLNTNIRLRQADDWVRRRRLTSG